MRPLAIIPAYLTGAADVDVLMTCLESLRSTAGSSCDVLVVDDGSPEAELVEAIRGKQAELEFDLHVKEENTGFARTVNLGLGRCVEQDRDAILVNADIEFIDPGWVERMVRQESEGGEGAASIVGGLLIYPTGLIQHGGVYFSILHRCFEHIYKYAPFDLPEAQVASTVPVTGALQFIRSSCLQSVGIYDEDFRLGWEDVDYCIRAWKQGHSTVYQPTVRAIHHESFFRKRPSPKVQAWTQASWAHFLNKYATQDFSEFIPSLV